MAHDILFVGADAGGNVPPMRAVAAELAARGHRIAFAGLDPPDPAEERVPLPAIAGREPGPATTGSAQLRGMVRVGLGRALGRETGEVVARRRPDVAVVDGMMLTAIRAAARTGVPVVALFHSFGAVWGDGIWQGPAGTVLRPFGLAPAEVWGSAAARLLLTDRELDPLTDDANTIGFEWTGTTERGAEPAPRGPGTPPLVLVSLSSVWQRDQDDVYRRILAALRPLPVRAIVTRSVPRTAFRGEIPPNVELLRRTPHADLLPRADLVIGHGGHSTTLSALAHGVPLLVLPMNRASDQRLIGDIVEENGLGLTLPRSVPPLAIRGAIRRILADGTITAAAARTGRRLRAQNGARVAADRIEAVVAR
ncbi:glycosyltransferase [Microbacterium capsulatum]|uniref:Glycosyltransferase n=1 Tax=Microbacterium capsulatum TaxID=3041921 RepID=A0ABU0XB96_9MICO|nr:glycosyltransferase [Microbacterium sp. ASV81]MDQ4212380.1 glycosyltransferase [Microbacterium sp. ASV81]